jgi:hypothetical protein
MSGFDAKKCKEVLSKYDWDVTLATNFLIGGLKKSLLV